MFSFNKSTFIASLMILSAFIGNSYNPNHLIADDEPAFILDDTLPQSFSTWTMLEQHGVPTIITPEQKQALENAYDQTLSRTYVNDVGEKIMLSIAYGKEQSETKNVHYPETCYPAQGFKVHSNDTGILNTQFGAVKVRRLATSLDTRHEPITYWVVVHNEVILSDYENRLIQVKYGVRGLVPDGLLFRISSITQSPTETQKAFDVHESFANALLTSLNSSQRLKLSGLK